MAKQKSHLNYDLFLTHREEILARKDLTHQLWLMMKAENTQIMLHHALA